MTNFATSTNLCLHIIKYRFTFMKTVNWFQDIPPKYRNTPFEISIHYEKTHGQEVKSGDTIAICESESPKFNFIIKAKCDGYYYRTEDWKRHLKYDPEEHIDLKEEFNGEGTSYEEFVSIWYGIGGVCESLQEWCDKEYSFSCEVIIDNITKSQEVCIDDYCIAYLTHDYDDLEDEDIECLEEFCRISIGLKNNRPSLTLIYPHKYFKIKKGDILYFCDSQSSYLELTAICSPYASGHNSVAVDFNLLEDDVNTLGNNKFEKLVIVHKDGRQRHTIGNVWVRDFDHETLVQKPLVCEPNSTTFKRYINTYKRALQAAGFTFVKEAQNVDVADVKLDHCFVYLMCDSKNGYHKIGISKTPEYRERTLQSEKPTIEMVCAKEYPSRKIAEAIESALHKVYERERIRGEWFNLSKTDVIMIQKTLQ